MGQKRTYAGWQPRGREFVDVPMDTPDSWAIPAPSPAWPGLYQSQFWQPLFVRDGAAGRQGVPDGLRELLNRKLSEGIRARIKRVQTDSCGAQHCTISPFEAKKLIAASHMETD